MTVPASLWATDRPPVKIGLVLAEDISLAHFAPVVDMLVSSKWVQLVSAYRYPGVTGHGVLRNALVTFESILKRSAHTKRRRRLLAALESAVELHSVSDVASIDWSASESAPDVIINCSFARLPESKLPCPVWSLCYEHANGVADNPLSVGRMSEEHPCRQVFLVTDTDVGGPMRIVSSAAARKPAFLSLDSYLYKEGRVAAEMLQWQLLRMQRWGEGIIEAQVGTQVSSAWIASGHLMTVRKVLARLLKKLAKQTSSDRRWQMGVRPRSADLPWHTTDTNTFNMIEAPEGHYFADPFVYEYGDETWLLAEDYEDNRSKGRLVCAPLSADGTHGAWQPILDLPFHLSFPLVFEHDEQLYLLPECAESGLVSLYRAVEFPLRWEKQQDLLDLPGLDTVPILDEDGTWYALTSVQSHGLPPHLLLFQAQALEGPWTLHPDAPLSSDVRFARNGGRIVETNGEDGRKRYRVSQDGTGKYGSRLHFHEITKLTPQRYEEAGVGALAPATPGYDGLHQYDRSASWETVDMAPGMGGD